MILYGTDTCSSCKQAKKLLTMKKIPFEYVDINDTDFEGQIPALFLDNKQILRGLGEINNYLKTNVATLSYDVDVPRV